jgi:NitT/TauT family transport system permease protein
VSEVSALAAGSTAAARPAPPSGAAGARWRTLGRKLGGLAIAVGIWALVSATGLVSSQALASVHDTVAAMAHDHSALISAIGTTLEQWAVGLGIAIAAGVIAGAVVGRSRIVEASTEVLVRMMRPLPATAVIPVAILLLGLGLKMTAVLVAFTSFWPIFINTRYGVGQVDEVLVETGMTLGLRGPRLMRHLVLPAAAPLIASGIQVSTSLALIVTVSVELIGGTGGIGTFVFQAQQGNDVPAMYAGIVLGGLVGWAINTGYSYLVRAVLPWQNRREESA